MPSPFPGMDPFLEHPQVFPDLHDRLITNLSEHLQLRLPPPYFAVIGSKVFVDVSESLMGPDVQVRRNQDRNGAGSTEANGGSVAVAAAVRRAPVVVEVPASEDERQLMVEIRTRQPSNRLVTMIEVLSLSNKTPGPDFEKYRQKLEETLASQVHLVEIDLLRGGRHATAVPHRSAQEQAGPFDYHVCIRAYDRPQQRLVYPILLADALPTINIPLLSGDAPVPLDLQAVFNRCYDAGPYARWVNYAETVPPPPLSREQTEWVLRLLHEKGLLPADPSTGNN